MTTQRRLRLTAMRQRVEGVAGRLAIESEPDAGPRSAPRSRDPGMSERSGAPPIRVMIVDDHPVVRNGLIGMFEGEPASRWSGTPATAPRRFVGRALRPT